ncbi:hypothetical protein [Solirhodobacter olei]|uniref:hypothetical protein n=1 Tax=Solirhodobacter olei TaxID=2493082 RepID=UPI000FDAB541|nr:hypothetical protein [Solirhodobacter olei]
MPSLARLIPILAATFALATPALADKIDGDWCAPGSARSLHIDGPAITTPGGHAVEGDYSRHFFSYTAPAGEPGAGTRVNMRLLNEMSVEIHFPDVTETWHRCQLNS